MSFTDDTTYGTGIPSYSESSAPPKEVPKLQSKREFDILAPGSDYVDPDGQTRTKPYVAKRREEFEAIPEGADYINPEGDVQTKPKYEGVGFTAQYLFDAAHGDDLKEKALRAVYGDKVKKGPLGVYIDDDGTMRRPDHGGIGGMLGHAAAETPPALGMAGGALAGGVMGTAAAPGVGTAAGGFGGLVLGAAAGRQFNNMILELAGVHQSLPEQITSDAWEGAAAAGGEVIGKAASKLIPVAKAVGNAIKNKFAKTTESGYVTENLPDILEQFGITPERARGFLGTSQDIAERNASIANRSGHGAAPSAFAPEAPGLKKIEEFDAVFRAQNVFGERAQKFYENEATKILHNDLIGAEISTPLTAAEKKVSSESAGKALIAAARRDMAHDDAVLENTLRTFKSEAEQPIKDAGGRLQVAIDHRAKLDNLAAAQEKAAGSAKAFVQAGLRDLHADVSQMLTKAAGENPSDLLRMAGSQFKAYNVAVRTRAKSLYDAADTALGGVIPDTKPLADDAKAFLDKMPEAIRSKYPSEIAQIAKLAGQEANEAAGESAIPAQELTAGQLRQLRSWLRHGVDYNDLTPDMRAGSLKFFEKKINGLLHDFEKTPGLEPGMKMLDTADKFYKDTIPYLDDQMVRTTLDALKSGVGADPEFVAKTFFDPLRKEAMRKARSIVGENLWRGVEAADTAAMLEHSKTRVPGQFDGKVFASQVLERVRNGILENGYSKDLAKRVSKIAEDIDKLEGTLPISADASDTVSSLMRKAQVAATEAEELAERDPLKMLSQEASKLDQEFNAAKKTMMAERKANPLHFLREDSFSQKFIAAADRTLSHQDLIMAAANQFGRESPEFKGLQKVYATRFFQRALGKTATMRAELGGEKGMTEEIQALMFPGVTRHDMVQLTKDMEFLFSGSGADMGGSLAAASRVLSPLQHIPIPSVGGLSGFIVNIPGVTVAARFALGKLFATVMDAVSHPNFANWLAGNLRGSPVQRDMARLVVQQRLKLGGLMGAGAGQDIYGENR